MQTQEQVRSRLFYDPFQEVWICRYDMEVLPVQMLGGKECVTIDGSYYPVDYLLKLYTGVNTHKKALNGITYHKASGRYNLRLVINGERRQLGYYKTQEEALHARKLIVGY